MEFLLIRQGHQSGEFESVFIYVVALSRWAESFRCFKVMHCFGGPSIDY